MTPNERQRESDVEDRRHEESRTNLWAIRDLSSGRFVEAKKRGGSFKGIRRER